MSNDSLGPLELDDEMKAAIGGAFESRHFVMVGYVGDDGWPHISNRGTVQVFGPQQLAFWARKPTEGLAQAVPARPQLTLFYADMSVPQLYTFYGRGEISTDSTVAKTVFENSPEREQALDPERKGVPVVVELERIEALGTRRFIVQR